MLHLPLVAELNTSVTAVTPHDKRITETSGCNSTHIWDKRGKL